MELLNLYQSRPVPGQNYQSRPAPGQNLAKFPFSHAKRLNKDVTWDIYEETEFYDTPFSSLAWYHARALEGVAKSQFRLRAAVFKSEYHVLARFP